jgi:putative Holliday junction resolvase
MTGCRTGRAIGREIRALCPQVLVVGVPYNADGSEGSMARATRDFGQALQARFALPVEHVDEHGSSLEAGRTLKEQRASGQRRRRVQRPDIDSAAAAIILTRWLAGEGDRKT